MNESHDPELRSWVESAREPGTDFPVQNLPFGVFRRLDTSEAPRVGVAIGGMILDVTAARNAGLVTGPGADACARPNLNRLMALGPEARSELRGKLSRLLREGGAEPAQQKVASAFLVPMDEAEMFVPATVGDYTDFYASIHHATNVGSMFRPDNPLLPNWRWMPIAYHGRASSVVVSGTPVVRPTGQRRPDGSEPPGFGPSRLLDYELEVGCFVGPGNELGEPIPLERAEDHLFGLCLVNDWSARDIQGWEYQPLGPFLGKSFATTVSPWIVTREALEPFRAPAYERPEGDPDPLPHLESEADRARGGIDITLEAWLLTAAMRERGDEPVRISRGSSRELYWTLAQMITHHTSNGCNLRPGDLFATGTVSGPTPESRGCLLERTWRGSEPLELPDGETRTFLEDGDEVILRGFCERDGYPRIGFGSCRGAVRAPATTRR